MKQFLTAEEAVNSEIIHWETEPKPKSEYAHKKRLEVLRKLQRCVGKVKLNPTQASLLSTRITDVICDIHEGMTVNEFDETMESIVELVIFVAACDHINKIR